MNRQRYSVQRHLLFAQGAEANAIGCVERMLYDLHREPWTWDDPDYGTDDPGRFGAVADAHTSAVSFLEMAWHSRVLALVEGWSTE